MGRISGARKSRGHSCQYLDSLGVYLIRWTVDYKIAGSRLRFSRQTTRDTDERGARAFCKRWGIDMPVPPNQRSDCNR
jgi:hypothetical protein